MTGGPLDIRASSETESFLLRLYDVNISILSLLKSGVANAQQQSESEVVKHEPTSDFGNVDDTYTPLLCTLPV
jgi:hypothetical protein